MLEKQRQFQPFSDTGFDEDVKPVAKKRVEIKYIAKAPY